MIQQNFLDKMQPTWASRHILGNNLLVAANTWSQMVTYVHTSLHLALGALLLPDFRTLDQMLPTMSNTHVFFQKKPDVGSNT